MEIHHCSTLFYCMAKMYVSVGLWCSDLLIMASVPFHCARSRQRLDLAAVLLPMKYLSVEVAELHLIIVQQAQTPWH